MPAQHHVENPFEYVLEKLSWAVSDIGRPRSTGRRAAARVVPEVRRIDAADLKDALRQGFADFAAARDDVLFIAIVYPIAGVVLAAVAMQYALLPMVFPLVSGFALIGPIAAIGLYEISRQREQTGDAKLADALKVFRSPALGEILGLALILFVLFFLWLAAAYEISLLTIGSGPPATLGGFLRQVFQTGEGWQMILIGIAVGFVFAVVAFMLSVVSVPLMLDRNVDLDVAIGTSIRAVGRNLGTMTLWGLIVAAALVLGSIPALVGLIVVVPVLGHATWHLYRKVVA